MWEKIARFFNWRRAPKPQVDIDSEIYLHLRPFRVPLILIVAVSMIGTLGYVAIDNMSLMDALYQTGITFTTVGFGEIAPISDPGRIFTVTLIIMGFAIFTLSIGIVADIINRGRLFKLLKERSMLYKVARLKNHFVIFYDNEYTAELSRQFRSAHVPFVVVDDRPDLNERGEQLKYPYYIQEAPHTELALRKSYLSSAKGAILLSHSTSNNIAMISTIRLFEKELGRNPYQIMVVTEDMADSQKLQKLGADHVVSPHKLMAQRLSAMAIRPDMENMLESFLYRRDTPLDMEEIVVPRHSWVVFKRLKETHLREITRTSIVGIKEKDGKFVAMPTGETQIMVDSRLIVIGTSKGIQNAKRLIRRHDKPEELRYA